MTLRNTWVKTLMLAGMVALSGCGSSGNSGPGNNAGGSAGTDGGAETGTGGNGAGGTEAGTGGTLAGGSAGTDSGADASNGGTSAGGSAGTSAGGSAGTSAGGSAGADGGADASNGGTSAGGNGGTDGGTGSACQNPNDCADPATMVCDPGTGTCQNDECVSSGSCSGSDVCLTQGTSTAGACYPSCTPFTSNPGCSNNYQCVTDVDNDSAGYCIAEGTTTEGQSCTPSSINSGCAAGMLCVTDANATVCRKLCHYFSSNPGCPNTQSCELDSVCSASGGDSANIGQSCSSNAVFGDSCAKASGAWRGVCVPAGGTGLTCLRTCRLGGTDCQTPQTCTAGALADMTVGVCE